MIIGKKDKEEFKRLKSENKMLNDEYFKSAHKDDLMNLVKAIINKFGTQEITISEEEIECAKQFQLYVTNDILSFNKIYRIVHPKQLLHSFKKEEQ